MIDDPVAVVVLGTALIIYVGFWVGVFFRSLLALWIFEHDDDVDS